MKHDPQFDKLEAMGDWEVEHDNQDIRGRKLLDESGKELGVIDELLIDTKAERVAAIRLKDGTACGIDRVEIHDDRVVYLNAAASTSAAGSTSAAAAAAGSAASAGSAAKGKTAAAGDGQSVPIVEEDVAIGKRAVEGGTIKVRSRTVKDKVEEDVKLRDEKVDVDRVAVNKDISGKDADRMFADNDKTVEVTARREEAVVSKDAKVTGEVKVSKDADERVEHVEETVRHTEVDVDRSGAERAKADKTKPRP